MSLCDQGAEPGDSAAEVGFVRGELAGGLRVKREALERLLERAPDLPIRSARTTFGAGPEFPYLESIVPALPPQRAAHV